MTVPRYPNNGNKERAIELFKQGLSPSQIAAQLGLSSRTVHTYIQRGRHQGILPKRKRGATPVFLGLPPVVSDWLVSITPEGAEVQDTVRSIVVDAYNEAQS